MNSIYFKTPKEWRTWLHANYDKETEVWLIFFKKESGKPSLNYESAVEEALCFGWIDSIIKKVDELKFVRKFTPRKDSSKWSSLNKARAEKLLESGRMTSVGLSKIKAAKKSGKWDQSDRPVTNYNMSDDFRKALNQSREAKDFFEQLAPGYQKQFIGWINVARHQETREKRIRESVQLLEKGEKLGLK